ncbi:MAG TPA: hypothetical protein ENF42_01445 [Candidatus Bathyarchaeota archaeon]|nr:hypothetical protein [Candidatus Bathyarchaeota archaeon]
MNIMEYLWREAKRITDSSMKNIRDRDEWIKTEDERRKTFIDMLGLTKYVNLTERPPLKATITGRLRREDYLIEKIHFQSLPRLYVTGNLYLPKRLEKPAPAVLYLCGHSLHQKHHYQAHARKFAQLGFVTFIIETVQRGEIRGHHHGTYHYGWFNWYSLGYTPAGVEVWNGIRALDLLEERREVDPERIGVTGISGGGAMSWFLAAVDKRVKVTAPVCGTATISSHVCKRTIEGHCDCMFWINSSMWDLTDVGALIAPRPLLIASAERDWIFDIESVRMIYRRLKKLYEILGSPENILLVETLGGHSYHERSRRLIFLWFLKHLMGVELSTEEVGDIDERPETQESLDDLKVFMDGVPPDERNTTVQEWFIKPADPPKIRNTKELEEHKERLVNTLLKKTFNFFPRNPCDPDIEIELVQESGDRLGYLIAFTPEDGWRLHMHIIRPSSIQHDIPVVLYLAKTSRTLNFGEEPLQGLNRNWARAIVEVRGIGETSWSPDLQWLIRRSAMLTGRTVASMRVYDCLRALDVLFSLDWIDRKKVVVFGSGEMAVVALYAALLNGRVSGVILHDPPASQNVSSNPDGTGPAIEMLNCLRYTDLPYVAGILWPATITFLGPRPDSYAWTEELYVKLGPPGRIIHSKDLSIFK